MDDDDKVIFLFGAGASSILDLPTMDKLWEGYFTKYKGDREDIEALEKIMNDEYGKADIEYLLSLISEIADPIEGVRLSQIYEEVARFLQNDNTTSESQISAKKLEFIKTDVERYIRKTLEKIEIQKVNLYKPFLTTTTPPLKIFTLNYDGLVEILCDVTSKTFSDGFNPEWDPKNFENKDVQLYKLHGSLFWLKNSSGKYFKVPLKGLVLGDTKYMSDEELSEMVIYPSMNKYKYTEVYTWLHNKFLAELKDAKICVVLGYSFRDREIKDIIIESMKNSDLRLIIVSPHSNKTKDRLVDEYQLKFESKSRIIPIKEGADIITKRTLNHIITTLVALISKEKEVWEKQYRATALITDWGDILNGYMELDASDGVKFILEDLKYLSIVTGNGNIEKSIFPIYIESIDHYLRNPEQEKLEVWFEYLIKFCRAIDQDIYNRLEIEKQLNSHIDSLMITNDEIIRLKESLCGMKIEKNKEMRDLLSLIDTILSADLKSSGSISIVDEIKRAYDDTCLHILVLKWKSSIGK